MPTDTHRATLRGKRLRASKTSSDVVESAMAFGNRQNHDLEWRACVYVGEDDGFHRCRFSSARGAMNRSVYLRQFHLPISLWKR